MILFLLISITLALNTFGVESCPEGWSFDDNSCIKAFTDKKSFSDARAVCQAAKGDLVEIKDGHRNGFVTNLVGGVAWVGIWDEDEDGKFSYVDGSSLESYAPWGRGEPNNAGGNERCVMVYGATHSKSGKWNDARCSAALPFVCGFEVCPDTWVYNSLENLCVKSYRNRAPFRIARATCQSQSGDLVKVKDESKKQFLLGLNLGARNWIGVWDEDEDNHFTNVDGSELGDFRPWNRGEPNNWGGKEHCAMMYDSHRSGNWNDGNCLLSFSFICEKQSSIVNCQEGWSLFEPDNICVKVFDDSEAYWEAEKTCQASNAHLMKISSDAQTEFIFQLKTLSHYWIGVVDEDEGGDFLYVDGSELGDYQPWHAGEPNNYGGIEHCGQLYGSGPGKGKWNDASCSAKNPFVCAKDA